VKQELQVKLVPLEKLEGVDQMVNQVLQERLELLVKRALLEKEARVYYLAQDILLTVLEILEISILTYLLVCFMDRVSNYFKIFV
jgi:RIO-like serine/threonine protein kinase